MSHIKFKLKNERPFRLVPSENGKHVFGGVSTIAGLSPKTCDVPCQQVFLLDLTDESFPVEASANCASLVLVYPFKYGGGGPEIQYAVLSDHEIEILYLSEDVADESEWQYLQIESLPTMRFDLVPLSYEEARYQTFMRENGYFQPSVEDRAISDRLHENGFIPVGGRRNYIVNAGTIVCRNPACARFGKPTRFELLTMVPPISVDGTDDFWYEFQGGDVDFCFGFCKACGTIISFNVAG